MKRYLLGLLGFYFFIGTSAFAQDVPSGRALSLPDILTLSQSIGGFLMIFGSVLAGIVVMVSGIMYFFAGSNQQKVKTAKDILKGGLIGTLILFGSGLIINTIAGIASNPFTFFE